MSDVYLVPDSHVMHETNTGIYIVSGPEGLVVDKKAIFFPAQGGVTRFIGFHTDLPLTVAAKEAADWVTLQLHPDGVDVTCEPNATGEDRTVTIEIKTLEPEGGEAQTAEVEVKQSKLSSLNFTVAPSIVDVDATQQEVDLDILTCDKAYTVFSGSSWFRIEPTYGNEAVTAKLSIDENKEGVTRRGQLVFRCGAKEFVVEVTQKKA